MNEPLCFHQRTERKKLFMVPVVFAIRTKPYIITGSTRIKNNEGKKEWRAYKETGFFCPRDNRLYKRSITIL